MSFKPLFIFSLPRSGSTLLQRMLACHPNIATVSEPWVLLPILTLIQPNSRTFSEFSIRSQKRALNDFLSKLPNGEKAFYFAARKFAIELYSHLSSQTTKYILDKTPRYYLIIDEIFNTFPEGKFIFLFRHPLATLASMCEALFGGRLIDYGHKIDAFKGPFLLTKGYAKYSEKSFKINYEKLVLYPHKAMKEMCNYLQLEYEPALLSNFTNTNIEGLMGDKKCYESKEILKDSLYKWMQFFASPYRKKYIKNYIEYLGKDTLSIMGYDFDNIINEIESINISKKFIFKDIFDILSIIKSKIYIFFEYAIIKDRINRKKINSDFYPLH